MKPLRWMESAANEAEAAAAYYADRSEGGGKKFNEQLWAAIAQIRDYPESGSPFGSPYRRVLFRSYPYSIVYRVDPDAIAVFAVRHDRMMPERWEQSRPLPRRPEAE